MKVESCKNCKSLLPPNLVTLYCPDCGIDIATPDYISNKKSFFNFRKVGRKQQILFTFLPLMLFVASFRVFKFKKTILMSSILSIGSVSFLYALYNYLVPLLNPPLNTWSIIPPFIEMIGFSFFYYIIPSVIIMLFAASLMLKKKQKKVLMLSILSIGFILYYLFISYVLQDFEFSKVIMEFSIIYYIIPSVIIMLFAASLMLKKKQKKVLMLSILSIGIISYIINIIQYIEYPLLYLINYQMFGIPVFIHLLFFSLSLWIFPAVVINSFIQRWTRLWNTKITFIENLK